MNSLWTKYHSQCKPEADAKAIVKGENYRFTVITPQLIRMEYSKEGNFEDRPTAKVLNRQFPLPQYSVLDKGDSLEIITDNLHLVYNKQEFSSNGLSIKLQGGLTNYRSIWFYGDDYRDLKGTARTLDEADGAIELERGLLSYYGYTVLDDSQTIVLNKDGWVSPKQGDDIDLYFIGYGRDYLKCLADFYKLSGEVPMVPRYALGNWWSRYYRYTDQEYKDLMERFQQEGIPLSVAVLDIDWHIIDIKEGYGSGWTGYTWNRELFKDPKEFMEWLHKKGMHITLNVHPADGVLPHEEVYEEMAKALGVDYENKEKIHFDCSDPVFMEAYFKYLHNTLEDIGVDFWWIDWQQKGGSRVSGLDTLWMLNHLHYIDSCRRGKRGITFSRYAGVGSHRYSIGFSGDSYSTWETLDFQPYFTSTASNVGYGWWSHDIGGHMHGSKNDERAARWVQFGVFSPVLRLHSTNNPFNDKEPWKYGEVARKSMTEFLRLRHKLIPYLFTMNKIFNQEGTPLVQPMYYRNPHALDAYAVKNQYYFGSDFIVCPITQPGNSELGMGTFTAWLPSGLYFDFFNHRAYTGNRKIDLYRTIETIPVLAKAGAIIPLTADSDIQNSCDNPKQMEIHVFAGESGEFTLYEDNSLTEILDNLETVETRMVFEWAKGEDGISSFTIDPVATNMVISSNRDYILSFIAVPDTENIVVTANGTKYDFSKEYCTNSRTLKLTINQVDVCHEMKVSFESGQQIATRNIKADCHELLSMAQIELDLKTEIYSIIQKHNNIIHLMSELKALHLDDQLLGALYEILSSYN